MAMLPCGFFSSILPPGREEWEESVSRDHTRDIETKIVQLRHSPEDTEAEELLDQMDKLALHDRAYANLHARCRL
jgi:hypothetical protein